MDTLRLFLLIAALIWFLLFTVLGNIALAIEINKGKRIVGDMRTVVCFGMDVIAISYLITRLIQWLS